LLREDESLASNNASRDDLFTYSLAGRLLKGRLSVLAVDGFPRRDTSWKSRRDISLAIGNFLVDVECKRPQSEANIRVKTEEARDQLRETLPPEMLGLIAIDASVACRDEREFIHRLAGRDFETALSLFLVDRIPQDLAMPQSIIGILLDFTYPLIRFAAVIDEKQADGSSKLVPRYDQTTYRRPTFFPNIRCAHQSVGNMLCDALADASRK